MQTTAVTSECSCSIMPTRILTSSAAIASHSSSLSASTCPRCRRLPNSTILLAAVAALAAPACRVFHLLPTFRAPRVRRLAKRSLRHKLGPPHVVVGRWHARRCMRSHRGEAVGEERRTRIRTPTDAPKCTSACLYSLPRGYVTYFELRIEGSGFTRHHPLTPPPNSPHLAGAGIGSGGRDGGAAAAQLGRDGARESCCRAQRAGFRARIIITHICIEHTAR
mmetsp:Transcript_21731/g.70185  ORF Transcript_21731/g.70185 Transcript_21731/m.70185 type:complete len:222 (-) Transcript_21731:7-672(-)